MDEPKKQLLEKIKSSTNILVTVSANPSVDQLSACIGLTLVLNKLEKHATAVFSGQVPSTLEFLKPDKTLEKNTDSLRDFIIALDKSKADKLRYKLEDNVVKIFITPYRTSLTADDLDFSQGDFNVDMVVALGVHQQADLDQAITAHGRILHDATVTVINNEPGGELGSINWQDTSASSLSEMVTDLVKGLAAEDKPVFDEQVATALLTGIVAVTDRFRNAKTSATTMALSGELIAAGANQQLVADQLEQELAPPKPTPAEPKPADTAPADQPAPEKPADPSGMLQIEHPKKADKAEKADKAPAGSDQATVKTPELPDFMKGAAEPKAEPAHEPTPPGLSTELPAPADQPDDNSESRPLVTEAPSFGGSLTANTTPEHEQPESLVDPLNMTPGSRQFLRHDADSTTEADTLSQASPVEPPKPAQSELPEAPVKTSIPEPKLPGPPKPAEPSIAAPPPPPEPTPPPAPVPAAPTPTPEVPQAAPTPSPGVEPPKPEPVHETLTELEQAVAGRSAAPAKEDVPSTGVTDVDSARDAVLKALSEQPAEPEPIAALNAQPLDTGPASDPSVGQIEGLSFGGSASLPTPSPAPAETPESMPFAASPADQPLTMPTPPAMDLPAPQPAQPPQEGDDPNAPPPVPPPMLPPLPPQ